VLTKKSGRAIGKSALPLMSGLHQVSLPGPKSATTRLMHRSNDEAMSSFRQACGLQSPGGYLIAEFWA
ncbi:MAG: hypothetical protein WBZ27_13920, partial [Pseudolabrys sp.]